MVALADTESEFTDLDRRAIRAAAFASTGIAFPLLARKGRKLGPQVTLLTPARFNLLTLCAPRLIAGSSASPHELLQALWILSAGYTERRGLRFRLFWLRWRLALASPCWCALVESALHRWHKLQLIDRPARRVAKDGAESEGSDRWFAATIDQLARRVPWLGASVLHTPYALIFQIISEQDATGREGQPRFNRARDQQAKAYLERKRRKRMAS